MPTGASIDLALLQFLRTQIRASDAQVVHAHLFEGALYAALASRLEGVPCVATLHGQVDVARGGLKSRLKQRLFRSAVRHVVAVSEVLRRDLQSSLAIPAERFSVIPNGVPVSDARADRDDAPSRPRRIIAIGNIRRPKDYPTLLDALALVRERVPDVHLDIAGQPDRDGLHESLQEQARTLHLDEHVTFHGFVSDPTELLRRADCFVLSSSQEGFSLATIEAMLAGVPVVATRSGGPEEILEHEVTGLLVPVRNAQELCAGICRILLDDQQLARRMAGNAAVVARERFSESAMVQAYETLYQELF